MLLQHLPWILPGIQYAIHPGHRFCKGWPLVRLGDHLVRRALVRAVRPADAPPGVGQKQVLVRPAVGILLEKSIEKLHVGHNRRDQHLSIVEQPAASALVREGRQRRREGDDVVPALLFEPVLARDLEGLFPGLHDASDRVDHRPLKPRGILLAFVHAEVEVRVERHKLKVRFVGVLGPHTRLLEGLVQHNLQREHVLLSLVVVPLLPRRLKLLGPLDPLQVLGKLVDPHLEAPRTRRLLQRPRL
mmetsp:Transcript_2886/g.11706  ORF Transcript_2886/g.11706 Transcript_2886/m.11706 type:complete len:245 (-) Transcript_2886:220-954(-)